MVDDTVQKRIVVIGDALIDVWVDGHLEPCQDRCPKFVATSSITCPGGAANVANCLINWNVQTELYAQEYLYRGVKTRYVHKGEIVFRSDNELDMVVEDSLRQDALEAIKIADAVILSDYDKGFLTKPYIHEVCKRAAVQGIPCIADAKRDPEFYDEAILKCNSDYVTIHPEVLARENTVVTYGSVSPTVVGETVPDMFRNVTCVNHVGAGDCFIAHLALALAHGFSLVNAIVFAHSAGRVYVQHPYNRPPRKTEIFADWGAL